MVPTPFLSIVLNAIILLSIFPSPVIYYPCCFPPWSLGASHSHCLVCSLDRELRESVRFHGEGNDPHSSTLAWKIPWTEERGGLQSMGSQRVGHDEATSLSLFPVMHWRRKWQPTPVFLPGESQGWRSLMGCRLWGRTESDTTEAT